MKVDPPFRERLLAIVMSSAVGLWIPVKPNAVPGSA
jgi:hypothetical protein